MRGAGNGTLESIECCNPQNAEIHEVNIDSSAEKKYHILDKNQKEEESWHLVRSLLQA